MSPGVRLQIGHLARRPRPRFGFSQTPLSRGACNAYDYPRVRATLLRRRRPPRGARRGAAWAGATRRRRRAASSRSRARRRPSPARSSTTSSRATRASPGAAPRSGSRPRPAHDVLLERAHFVVVDLETTGLSPRTRGSARSGRSGCVPSSSRTRFETLVDPRAPLPPARAALTGIPPAALRGAPRIELARAGCSSSRVTRRSSRTTRASTSASSTARSSCLTGSAHRGARRGHRLARERLLANGRAASASRRSAHFFGVSTDAVPPARSPTRRPRRRSSCACSVSRRSGARGRSPTSSSSPRPAPAAAREALARRAARRPGPASTSSAAREGLPLYVGRARDLRARLRSYFAGGRQRPAVEARAAARWSASSGRRRARSSRRRSRSCASCASCGRRRTRGARGPTVHVYLRRRGERWTVTEEPARTARSRAGASRDAPRRRSPVTRATIPRPPWSSSGAASAGSRATSGSRTRRAPATASRRWSASSRACRSSTGSGRSAPAWSCPRGNPASSGRTRSPAGASPRSACCRAARACGPRRRRSSRRQRARTAPRGPEDVDELRLVASFLRKPPPELRVAALERDAICALVDGIPLAA